MRDTPPDQLAAGTVVAGRYEIVRLVERRSASQLYEATQSALSRRVALKVLPRTDDPRHESRFNREAEALGRLNHPACIDVYDYGAWGVHLYLAVGWVDGHNLESQVGQPMDPLEAVQLCLDVAHGLEHAHARGVVHRDVKPSRIVVGQDGDRLRAHLVDFSLARLEDADWDTTAGRSPLGTPGYIAPERLHGARGGPESDVYALGIVLYQLLTGQHPFARQLAVDMLAAQAEGRVPPLELHLPKASRTAALVWTVDRATRRDPADRLPDGAALVQALEACRASLLDPGTAGMVPWLDHGQVVVPERLQRWVDRATPPIPSPRNSSEVDMSDKSNGGPLVVAGAAIVVAVAFLIGAGLLTGLWMWWGA